MGFTSQIYPNEVIINDTSIIPDPPEGQSRGLSMPFNRGTGYAYGGIALPFPKELIIPKNEWQARIQEKEERKTRLSDIVDQAGLPCLDQNGTSYCWINAPTHCLEILRVLQNQEMVLLSPASAGGPIKGFRNQGGWGKEGLEWIVKNGVCPVADWPANAIQKSYYTEANKAKALLYRADEWWELIPRNLEEQVSCLLRGFPVAVGLNYWSHEVTDYEAVWLDGDIAIRFRNSWGMGWGERGYGIRQGSKRLADDAVSPTTALAS